MRPEEELSIKVAKEIVIKFIEIGRLSLNGFDDAFRQVHRTVRRCIKDDNSGSKGK